MTRISAARDFGFGDLSNSERLCLLTRSLLLEKLGLLSKSGKESGWKISENLLVRSAAGLDLGGVEPVVLIAGGGRGFISSVWLCRSSLSAGVVDPVVLIAGSGRGFTSRLGLFSTSYASP